MDKIKVLVTSAGVTSAINVIKSLRLCKDLSIEITAVDSNRLAPGLYLADELYAAPEITNEDKYVNFLINVCKKKSIHAIFPCYSREIVLLSRYREKFENIGARMLIASPETIKLCNDKIACSQFVSDLNIPVPRIINNPGESELPLFSRLVRSSGSRGSVFIGSARELEKILDKKEDRIYQEFIEGDEYTVDVLCNGNYNCMFSGPRRRIQTKLGQSVIGKSISNKSLNDYSMSICRAIKYIGVGNIQFIEKDKNFYFIEFNPRYAAGGLMLTVHAGANLALAALKLMLDLPLSPKEFIHDDGIIMTKYWEEIIINNQRI